jgi:hypothetical protein
MSDMSSLSHEYASSADFSRSLNAAVLLLKKRFSHGVSTVNDGEFEDAVARLRATLAALLSRLKNKSGGDEVPIPEDVFERIVDQHRGSMPHFEADLSRVLEALSGQLSISRDELEFLDGLCVAADASASATFRKLWRR